MQSKSLALPDYTQVKSIKSADVGLGYKSSDVGHKA